MDLYQATDDFLMYLEIERNCSGNTLRSYDLDLRSLISFMKSHDRPLDFPVAAYSLTMLLKLGRKLPSNHIKTSRS